MERGLVTKYEPSQEPIVLSKGLLDLLLKQENPADLIALYTFYYYTAKWQKTNMPKATTEYVARGLGWSDTRVIKTKKQLMELNLIKNETVKNETGKIIGHYILVNFIWSNETLVKNQTTREPQGGFDHRVVFDAPNALSNSILNALSNSIPNALVAETGDQSTNKKDKHSRTSKYLPMAVYLAGIILTYRNINTPTQQLMNWAHEFRKLEEIEGVSIGRMKKALVWYKQHCRDEYVPIIESGIAFRNKFVKLEDAMLRDTKPRTQKRKTTIGYMEPDYEFRGTDEIV